MRIICQYCDIHSLKSDYPVLTKRLEKIFKRAAKDIDMDYQAFDLESDGSGKFYVFDSENDYNKFFGKFASNAGFFESEVIQEIFDAEEKILLENDWIILVHTHAVVCFRKEYLISNQIIKRKDFNKLMMPIPMED